MQFRASGTFRIFSRWRKIGRVIGNFSILSQLRGRCSPRESETDDRSFPERVIGARRAWAIASDVRKGEGDDRTERIDSTGRERERTRSRESSLCFPRTELPAIPPDVDYSSAPNRLGIFLPSPAMSRIIGGTTRRQRLIGGPGWPRGLVRHCAVIADGPWGRGAPCVSCPGTRGRDGGRWWTRRTKRDQRGSAVAVAVLARAFVRRVRDPRRVPSRRGPLRRPRRSPFLRASVPRACARKRDRALAAAEEGVRGDGKGRGQERPSMVCAYVRDCRSFSVSPCCAVGGPKIDKWTTSASSSPSSVVPRARFPGCRRATETREIDLASVRASERSRPPWPPSPGKRWKCSRRPRRSSTKDGSSNRRPRSSGERSVSNC